MDIVAELETSCGAERVCSWVDRLELYPRWLELVREARPVDGDDPAWVVDLRAKVGPLARSKRLRMVRTEHVHGVSAVFERRELDSRRHSPWVLRSTISGASSSRLVMSLHYGGGLWAPVLERVLQAEVDAGRARLTALLTGSEEPPAPTR